MSLRQKVRQFILGFKGEILILVKMKLPFRILRAPPPKKTTRKFCTLDLARMSHLSNKSLREFSLPRGSEIFSDFLLEKIRICFGEIQDFTFAEDGNQDNVAHVFFCDASSALEASRQQRQAVLREYDGCHVQVTAMRGVP